MMSRVFSGASRSFAAVGAGAAVYDFSKTNRDAHNYVMLGAELGMTRLSMAAGPLGVAAGVGWEMGRAVTNIPAYQRWRNGTLMPWRYRNFGY